MTRFWLAGLLLAAMILSAGIPLGLLAAWGHMPWLMEWLAMLR